MPDTTKPAKERALTASPIQSLIDGLLEKYRPSAEGEVASYIPELAAADPDRLGIAVATADGHVYEAGDSGAEFTIQSISKPIVYGLALECHGRDVVLAKIGVEAARISGARIVDVSSGVETRPGIKDPGKIRAFLAIAATL